MPGCEVPIIYPPWFYRTGMINKEGTVYCGKHDSCELPDWLSMQWGPILSDWIQQFKKWASCLAYKHFARFVLNGASIIYSTVLVLDAKPQMDNKTYLSTLLVLLLICTWFNNMIWLTNSFSFTVKSINMKSSQIIKRALDISSTFSNPFLWCFSCQLGVNR